MFLLTVIVYHTIFVYYVKTIDHSLHLLHLTVRMFYLPAEKSLW